MAAWAAVGGSLTGIEAGVQGDAAAYMAWGVRAARVSVVPYMHVLYEERWEQPLAELRAEMGIPPPPLELASLDGALGPKGTDALLEHYQAAAADVGGVACVEGADERRRPFEHAVAELAGRRR